MRKALLLAAAIGIATTLGTTPSFAQGAFNMGMLTNTLSQGANIQSEQARASRQSFPTLLRSRPRPARINPALALYRASGARRQRNIAQFIARTKQLDPAMGAEMQRSFAQHDVLGQIFAQMRGPIGLNPNSVADAMAVYLVTSYYAARGNDDSTPADFRAVARQMTRAVATTPAIARASDATKQEIAEAMLIQGVMIEQNVNLIKKENPGLMPKFRQAVALGVQRTFGTDLTKLRLGSAGLQ